MADSTSVYFSVQLEQSGQRELESKVENKILNSPDLQVDEDAIRVSRSKPWGLGMSSDFVVFWKRARAREKV